MNTVSIRSSKSRNIFGRELFRLVVVLGILLSAFAVDYLLPHPIIVTSLYAIPILTAAYWFNPKNISLISLLVILLFMSESIFEHTDAATLGFSLLGLCIVSILAVQFCRQRLKASLHAKELETTHKQLQSFLSMVSHDLSQPLTSMRMSVQILEKTEESPTEKPTISSMENSVRQMERLVTDLKDAASIGTDKFVIHQHEMDLTSLLKEIVKQKQRETTNHKLILHAPKMLQGIWDENRLQQMLTNLISNAIKYSPQGGSIIITAEKKQKHTRVTITDSGLGMTKTQIGQLFQPFSRQHTSHNIAGTGLGLYITKAIAEAHKGKIWVESKPKNGSTFFVELPN